MNDEPDMMPMTDDKDGSTVFLAFQEVAKSVLTYLLNSQNLKCNQNNLNNICIVK